MRGGGYQRQRQRASKEQSGRDSGVSRSGSPCLSASLPVDQALDICPCHGADLPEDERVLCPPSDSDHFRGAPGYFPDSLSRDYRLEDGAVRHLDEALRLSSSVDGADEFCLRHVFLLLLPLSYRDLLGPDGVRDLGVRFEPLPARTRRERGERGLHLDLRAIQACHLPPDEVELAEEPRGEDVHGVHVDFCGAPYLLYHAPV